MPHSICSAVIEMDRIAGLVPLSPAQTERGRQYPGGAETLRDFPEYRIVTHIPPQHGLRIGEGNSVRPNVSESRVGFVDCPDSARVNHLGNDDPRPGRAYHSEKGG